jgi:Trk K+ transport system NAD-binding subunit
MFHSSSLAVALKRKIQQELVDSKYVQPACFEELLLNTKGYGVSQIEITQNNLLLDKTLAGSGLREHDILVLSIERGDEHILNPSSDTRFMLHDKLVCFGKMHNIRELAYEKR